jgi:predicted GIY-YIG superfamily endonuclease
MTVSYETPAGLHAVYAIELEAGVATTRRFARKNPDYRPGKPCYYIDVTDLAVDLRFDQHKHDIRSNAFVREYGIRLRPDLTEATPPAPYAVGVENESVLARALRGQGCGVWAPVIDAPQASSVYVVRLDPAVLAHRRFRDANPDYVEGSPCVYVGATGVGPERRFANHRSGHKANWYVQHYGEALVPDLFAHLNPMTYQRALATEIALADELRLEGFAVWQH